jgi:tetratricopeptide (TPR) repeat protein
MTFDPEEELMKTRIVLASLAFLLLSLVAFAQHEHAASTEAPAILFSGMGSLHHPIATTNPEAQKFFDQGLTLIYAFNHDEAVRSFRRAAELDPKAAMAWWGIASALGPNYNLDVDPKREKAAFDAVQKAKQLAATGPANERDYIEVLATRYSDEAKPDYKALSRNYAHAMGELAKKYPDDPDAATMYAESLMDLNPWNLWSLDGTPAEGTLEIVAVLESVLSRYPNHPGANHYYIHAVEASPHAAWALPSAERLPSLVPNGGHLVHMPAHIYSRIGDFESAMSSNTSAAKVDRDYIAATGVKGVYPAMYYSHNLHFLAYAAMEAGNFETARKSAEQLAENIQANAEAMPLWMNEEFVAYRPYVLVRFRKWQEILAAPAPDAKEATLVAAWNFARGMAFASGAKIAEAEGERNALAAAVASIPADQPYGFSKSGTVLQIPQLILEARISEARGDRKAAIESLRKTAAIEDTLPYNEPPTWFYPVRESLGGMLLRDGQAAEAEKVFRADLARNPRNGRSLYGLWQSLAAQNKTADADWAKKEFEAAWKDADTQLTTGDL